MLMSSCVEGLRCGENLKESLESVYSRTYAKIYESEKIHGKISKEKTMWGINQWRPGTGFQESCLSSHTGCTQFFQQ